MTMDALPVAILGAGLTGMSAAHHLQVAGVRCAIFEKADRVGGHAITVEERGYRFDRTGHLLHLKDHALRALALGWIGPDYLEVERNSAVFSHGVYTGYPFQANSYGLPSRVAYDCVMGFLRAQSLRDKEGASPVIDNFEQFCRVHFGDGISDHFMIPYNTRLWGVAPREISAAWCQRFVPIPNVEDVIAGAFGVGGQALGYNTRFIYPKRGISQLPDGMAAALQREGVPLRLRRAPQRIDLRRRALCFADGEVAFDTLISTAPLTVLLALCDPLPDEVRRAAAKLRCTHLCYLDVALRRPPRTPHHWVYLPEARFPFYRVGCYSHFSRHMAPPGKGCLYVELASREPPPLAELLPQIAAGLVEMGIIAHPEIIVFARQRRIDQAYVIFDHHYFDALACIEPFLASQRIVSAGRYGGWNYSSMGDALRFGQQACEHALRYRGQRGANGG